MPGNLAELRPLVFIAAFVGFTFLLVGMMVSESPAMFSGQTTGTSPISSETVPNPLGIIAWNSTLNIQLGINEYDDFTYSGYNIRFCTQSYPEGEFRCFTFANWLFFYWNIEEFQWFSKTNVKESVHVALIGECMLRPQIESDYASKGLEGLQYQWRNSKTKVDVIFTFDTLNYTSPINAFDHDKLYLVLNANWSERLSSMNALSFIAGLFTFSLPGIPFVVNAILWVMIFPSLGYLAFVFVLKIIGSIFGGG